MKLKVNESIVIPNLLSVFQSYDRINNFIPGTMVAFGDIEDLDSLVKEITSHEFNTITVLDDANEPITTFKVGEITSIDKTVNPELQIMIRFA